MSTEPVGATRTDARAPGTVPSESANVVRRLLDDHLGPDAPYGPRDAAPCVHTPAETYSYADIHERVGRTAAALYEAGVRHGSRVSLVLPDTPEQLACVLGLLRLGAVAVPLATQLTESDYRRILADCRPALVIAGPAQQPRVRPAVPDGCPLWESVDLGHPPRHDRAAVLPEDPAVIQYTSGSTGVPSGVVHTHRGVEAVLDGFPGLLGLGPEDVCLSSAKLSFGYGFGNSLLFPLSVGAATVLLQETSDAPRFLHLAEQRRPTVLFAGPALYAAMLTVLERGAEADLGSVRRYVSAGEPLPASLLERWRERTGSSIVNGLGSTECLHVFIATDATRSTAEPGSVPASGPASAGDSGRVVPGYEAQLRDDCGEVLGDDETGHLWIKGAACAARYWDDPVRTEATMVDGWVRTGDQLRRDPDGSYHFVARSDDVLKVGGFKVAPTEVEDQLLRHPGVRECAVVGVSGSYATTEIVAYVRPADGADGNGDDEALRAQLRRYVREVLAPFKRPRSFHVVQDLPRTSTNKIARHVLREASATGGRWTG